MPEWVVQLRKISDPIRRDGMVGVGRAVRAIGPGCWVRVPRIQDDRRPVPWLWMGNAALPVHYAHPGDSRLKHVSTAQAYQVYYGLEVFWGVQRTMTDARELADTSTRQAIA